MDKESSSFEKARYNINNSCCIGNATLENDDNNEICKNSLDELMKEKTKEKDCNDNE